MNRTGLRLMTRWGLLVLLTGIMLGVTSDSSAHDARLYGCRQMGIDPYRHDSGPGEINYSLASSYGTYVAVTSRFSDHGCVSLVIYQCEQQTSSAMGCSADMPGQSHDWVLADAWVSDHELRIKLYDRETQSTQTEIIDTNSLFA